MADSFDIRDGLALAGLSTSVLGSGLWLRLMRPGVASGAYGRICVHAGAALHCPACYAAAAVVALGFAAMVAALRPLSSHVVIRTK